MICEAMNWCHLPVAGGLYDQHPELLNQWLQIWSAKHEVDEAKRRQQENKSNNKSSRRR